jgi:hypothetical protein
MRFIIRRTVIASGHAGDCDPDAWLAENLQKMVFSTCQKPCKFEKKFFFALL